MHQRFTSGEYWVLSSAVHLKYPVACLIEPEYEVHYNRRSHGLGVDEMVTTLADLFAEGLLEVECWSPTAEDPLSRPLTRGEIRPALHGQPARMDYRLTEKGGAAWEAFARPNWESFISHERADGNDDRWVVTCMNRRLLARYLFAMALYERIPAIRTAEVREVGEWPATYWKTLPRGFRAYYPDHDDPELAQDPEECLRRDMVFSGINWMRDRWCWMAK